MRRSAARAMCAAVLAIGLLGSGGPGQTLVIRDRTIFVPDGSPVKLLPGTPEDADGLAAFEGRIVMTGRYSYGVVMDGTEEFGLEFSFTPDQSSVANLPRLADNPYAGYHFDNEDEAIAAIVPANSLALLKARKIKSIEGRASIVIDHFTLAGYPCDTTAYIMHFVSLYRPLVARNSGKDLGEFSGCG